MKTKRIKFKTFNILQKKKKQFEEDTDCYLDIRS